MTDPEVRGAADSLMPWFVWPTMWAQTLCQWQRAQVDAVTSWQQAVAGLGQELMDEWVAHCAGGVPLDG